MGEYEDRYPESFGRGEETDPTPQDRHFAGTGLPHQVRDGDPAVAEEAADARSAAAGLAERPSPAEPSQALPPTPRQANPRRVFVEREPGVIQADVKARLSENLFVDASGIAVSVAGAEVTLDGAVDTLFAVSVVKSLAANVPGVSRVETRLRVVPVRRGYEPPPAPGEPPDSDAPR